MLSITVAIGAKVVGSLVVSSMIVLPTAIAMQFKRGYKETLIISTVISVVCMIAGLTISYYVDWAPGATIVLITVSLLVLAFLIKAIISLIRNTKLRRA